MEPATNVAALSGYMSLRSAGLSGHCSNPSEPFAKLLEASDSAPRKQLGGTAR